VKPGRVVLLILVAVLIAGVVMGTASILGQRDQAAEQQQALDPFYTPPNPLPQEPGKVIRVEPLTFDDSQLTVQGGSAYRMLYVSQRPDGTAAASGAMVFVPDAPAPESGRNVVAWAHGTVGMGDPCAPSRNPQGTEDMAGWLEQMMALGWVVVGTDYVGLGTPGTELYLVAQAEARAGRRPGTRARQVRRIKSWPNPSPKRGSSVVALWLASLLCNYCAA